MVFHNGMIVFSAPSVGAEERRLGGDPEIPVRVDDGCGRINFLEKEIKAGDDDEVADPLDLRATWLESRKAIVRYERRRKEKIQRIVPCDNKDDRIKDIGVCRITAKLVCMREDLQQGLDMGGQACWFTSQQCQILQIRRIKSLRLHGRKRIASTRGSGFAMRAIWEF